MSLGKKEIIIAVILIAVVVSIVGYNYFPQSQEVVLVFSDGSEKTIRPLFQVSHNDKEVQQIKLITKEQITSHPTITTPLGTFNMNQQSENMWNISVNEIFNYSVEEGHHNIIVQSELGKKEFDLNFKDNREIIIIFD